MSKVAVIGGSGNVGRTMVDALKAHPDHTVIVFGRKLPKTQDPEAPVVMVDYSDITGLVAVLEEHQIDTVISCVVMNTEGSAAAQSSAITAADKSSTTKRFLATNWATPSNDSKNPWGKCLAAAQAQLRETSLVWTEIATGYFSDFWGQPYIKSHMPPVRPGLEIKDRIAGIPGTGNEPVSFAYSLDVTRFIAEKLLFVPDAEWEPVSLILGDRLTWNEFLALAKEARGGEFDVRYDSVEDLEAGNMRELPNHVESYMFFPKLALRGLYSALCLLMAKGGFNYPLERSINARKFPDFKMLTVKEMLQQTWGTHREDAE
ncbi:hypothetical protein F5X68DRAFT_265654 [Plectosphaerella plurivora]|uniref:NAD(P)-binding domain-containing protein n=1 Tax=Plectosphaerella plurivora TaxID=936078 RepID=A0A9P9A6N7_9PEZI|nr:hypothetical protein F5X68DRAFT_265654 [Plectosphaerella plurivora]